MADLLEAYNEGLVHKPTAWEIEMIHEPWLLDDDGAYQDVQELRGVMGVMGSLSEAAASLKDAAVKAKDLAQLLLYANRVLDQIEEHLGCSMRQRESWIELGGKAPSPPVLELCPGKPKEG